MEELHHRLPPGEGRGAHGQHLVEQGGEDLVSGLKLQKHREGDAVRPWGRGLVGSLEDLPDVPRLEGAGVKGVEGVGGEGDKGRGNQWRSGRCTSLGVV